MNNMLHLYVFDDYYFSSSINFNATLNNHGGGGGNVKVIVILTKRSRKRRNKKVQKKGTMLKELLHLILPEKKKATMGISTFLQKQTRKVK